MCTKLNKQVFADLKSRYSVDFYIHTWDRSTGGLFFDNVLSVDQDLKKFLGRQYQPVAIEIENPDTVDWGENVSGDPNLLRAAQHIYTVARSVSLVNRRYDCILVLRMDQWFCHGLFPEGFLEEKAGTKDVICTLGGTGTDMETFRDEGFLFYNQDTAFKFPGVYRFFVEGSEKKLPDWWVPEKIFSEFIKEQGISVCDSGFGWDRVIVRQPLDEILDPRDPFHRRLLKEVREWVDWCTKDPNLFRKYVEYRVAGVPERESLKELSKISGIDFIKDSGFDQGLKFGWGFEE